MRTGRLSALVWTILSLWGFLTSVAAAQEPQGDVLTDTRAPYVRLFDTVAPLSGLRPSPADAASWSLVKEGDTAHSFTGDAVFLNDRMVVILKRGGRGAEIYAKTPGGLRPRAQVVPRPSAANGVPALASVRVVENKSSGVTLEAAFRAGGRAGCTASFRLVTGDVLLEARAGAGTSGLALQGSIRYVVIPDYFGDDMVFGPDTSAAARIGLPAENFFLSLLTGGDAIIMCVWASGERNADLVFTGAGAQRAIGACEVESREGESVWVALLEGTGTWHDKGLPAESQKTDVALGWRPPFAARWRADLVGRDGVCESWELVDQQEREGQPGAVSSSGLAEPASPCWFDSTGAHVRVPPSDPATAPDTARPEQAVVVIYPLDRDRATPLTRFCPVDVMRNALGVGPCQYILEVEGFPEGDAATAAEVTRWVEKQFEKKKDEQESAAIKERLALMTGHIETAQARAEQYSGFARQVRTLCESEERNGAAADTARRLQKIAADMEQTIAGRREAMKTPAHAADLAKAMIACIGRNRPLAEVQAIGEQLRSIGAAQDGVLSKCRLAVRRLKQECRIAAGSHPEPAGLVRTVGEQADKLLRAR